MRSILRAILDGCSRILIPVRWHVVPVNQLPKQSRAITPQQCFAVSGIDTQTGNIANANDGINTRFDLYQRQLQLCKNNPFYGPASNVRKGWTPGNGANGACNPDQQPILPGGQVPPVPFGNYRAMGFPLDNNMITNGVASSDPSGRRRNLGVWRHRCQCDCGR